MLRSFVVYTKSGNLLITLILLSSLTSWAPQQELPLYHVLYLYRVPSFSIHTCNATADTARDGWAFAASPPLGHPWEQHKGQATLCTPGHGTLTQQVSMSSELDCEWKYQACAEMHLLRPYSSNVISRVGKLHGSGSVSVGSLAMFHPVTINCAPTR